MEPSLRKAYNEAFRQETFQAFLKELDSAHPAARPFRLAETPVFVPRSFGNKMIETCEYIIDLIIDPSFKPLTEQSIPASERVPGENDHPHMIVFDFAVCLNSKGEPEPRLIELQGFPSLYGFQAFYPDLIPKYFPIPKNYSQYLGAFDRNSYVEELKSVILGRFPPENVILLEIQPHRQKTAIDFYCTRDLLGIEPVCITELIQEGRDLYYMRKGVKTPVKRIYNRVIFDELNARKNELGNFVDITQDLDVQWAPHPSWFYRISKFTLPFIRHPYAPDAFFLGEIKQLPEDLHNYVLKPLFSFGGQGVVIDIKKEDLLRIKDPDHWILQKKAHYADIILTPDIPAKAEIRIMYLWKDGDARPKPAINLARLSKGKMIGVSYNADKEWVGGSVAFFEK